MKNCPKNNAEQKQRKITKTNIFTLVGSPRSTLLNDVCVCLCIVQKNCSCISVASWWQLWWDITHFCRSFFFLLEYSFFLTALFCRYGWRRKKKMMSPQRCVCVGFFLFTSLFVSTYFPCCLMVMLLNSKRTDSFCLYISLESSLFFFLLFLSSLYIRRCHTIY